MTGTAETIIWTAQAAAAATGGQKRGDWAASGVSIDSRHIQPGDLFVALVGENNDGHDYVAQALSSGAVAAIVSRDVPVNSSAEQTLLRVPDTYKALWAMAAAARDRSRAKIVAITGSVGKTGTKSMVARGLSACGNVHASRASHNNAYGVPLSLAALPQDADFGVFEIGMNHPDEIRPLTKLVKPHVAVITNVAATHLGHFADLEEIADAKAEILEGLADDGTAILNQDNPYFARLRAAAMHNGARHLISFGESSDSDIRLMDVASRSWGMQVTAQSFGQTLMYRLSLHGDHWAFNSLIVAAVAHALGRDEALATRALNGMSAPTGRGARHAISCRDGDALLIDDSYNASPASMSAALKVLAIAPVGPEGRRIAVLGDMLELGPDEASFHAALAPDIIRAAVDRVFLAGPHMEHLKAKIARICAVTHADRVETLIDEIVAEVSGGDAVLVKGSLGSRMGLVVDRLLSDSANEGGRHAV